MGTYLGNLDPNSTFLGDIGSTTRLATSAPFRRYLQEGIFERSAFIRSGVLRRDPRLQATIGTRIEAPFFDPINATEEVIQSNATWGTSGAGHFTSQNVTASTQYATITHRGFMYSADDLSKLGSGEDPLAFFRSQLADDLNRKRTAKLVSMLQGIFTTALNGNELNKSVTTGAAEANYLTAANVTEAKYLLGERGDALSTLVVHPTVAAYLEQIGALTFSTSALAASGAVTWGGGGVGLTSTDVRTFMGLNVVVDSQMPIEGTSGQQEQFVCYLMGPGAVYEGEQMPLRLEAERNVPSMQDLVAVNYHHVYHLPGVSWGNAADNPTNAALATSTNWTLAFNDRRMIPAVKLVVNSPFGGLVP
jgi:hypothetical protein